MKSWLAVQKDLLDQQIIDTHGRKVVRVNDVELSDQRTNGNTELRVTQVDVGLPGAFRRLLQGMVPPTAIRRVQEKLPQRTIRWEFVNLVEPDPLRRDEAAPLQRESCRSCTPPIWPTSWKNLSPDERQSIIGSLDEETAAETIAELDKRLQTQVVEKLDPEKAADIIEEMSPDAAADLMQNLEPETSREVLDEMDTREASDVEALLNFAPDTAGGMMTTEIVSSGRTPRAAKWSTTSDSTRSPRISSTTSCLINREAKLAGTVPIARLVLASSDQRMAELAFEPLLSVTHRYQRQRHFRAFRQIQFAQPDRRERRELPDRRDHCGRRGEPHAREAKLLGTPGWIGTEMNTWITLTDTLSAWMARGKKLNGRHAALCAAASPCFWRWSVRGSSLPTWTTTPAASPPIPSPAPSSATPCCGR